MITSNISMWSAGVSGASGAAEYASEAVKARIRTFVSAEGTKVLSDDDLVEALKGEGVDIARRTVAKYREAMHIPSSVQRKRQVKSEG